MLARVVVLGIAALAIFVQLAVWGATKIRVGGALLESWQPYFGWPYGLGLAAAQLAVCRWLHVKRGPVWLVRTWLIVAVLVVGASRAAGRAVGPDETVALVSGFGAVVLAAGLFDGRLVSRR